MGEVATARVVMGEVATARVVMGGGVKSEGLERLVFGVEEGIASARTVKMVEVPSQVPTQTQEKSVSSKMVAKPKACVRRWMPVDPEVGVGKYQTQACGLLIVCSWVDLRVRL